MNVHGDGCNLLREWLIRPFSEDTKVGKFEIQELAKPYQEIAYLFTRIIGQDTIS